MILFRDRPQAFVDKLLHALPAIGLGGEDVALRIGGDAVHGVEFAGLPAAFAEARQDFERFALQDVDLFVRAIGQIDVLLLRILREGDVPHRSVAQRSLCR